MKQNRIMLNTTIAVFLSINVQVEQNGQTRLFTLPLLSLTTWLLGWWRLKAVASRLREDISICLTSIRGWCMICLVVSDIGFKSILYGAGVTL